MTDIKFQYHTMCVPVALRSNPPKADNQSQETDEMRVAAEYLARNFDSLGKIDLLRRFNWLRVKFQVFWFRRTGNLYRFNLCDSVPFDRVDTLELGYFIADAVNRLLIDLHSMKQESLSE